MNEKLKPCPFCGGDDISPKWILPNGLWHCICETPKCHGAGPRRLSKEEAIETWNRRAYDEQ